MKVGDIVRQSGKLVEFRGRRPWQPDPMVLGVVISIDKPRTHPKRFSKWQNFLGRSVTVMWANDRMVSVAENALEVVDV